MQNQNNLSMNDFEIISKLGKGSFGVVYKVKKKSNKSIYVMKQINISSMKSKMRSIALNEVKILKSLENPYVVKYYDSFIERDQLNIIMEYCEGGDLSQYIKSHTGKQVAEAKIWKFFIQMCVGLDYIHHKKILHRDIKALNIFLTKDGDIRIGDLGVAKILADSVNFAHTMVGTPYYLSPEMCEEKPYNEKSDIWALGCVLYELCVQKHPFQAHSQGTLILKIIKGRYSPVSSFYSQELIEIVNLCLNRDYKKRPTASTLLRKQSVIDKAKSLNISLQPVPRLSEPKPKKEPEIIAKEIPAVSKDGIVGVGVGVRPTENKVEKKVKNNNEGKVHVFMKNELLPKKVENEVIKPAAPTPVNKIEIIFKNPVPVKPKENIEIVAKAVSDKRPSPANNLMVGEKIVNKPLPVPVSNKDRVRKGAPVELSRQAKNAVIPQKLVKKVNVEPPKIFRPPLLEDKEKAPQIKSPTELPGEKGQQFEKKKSREEYKVEITAEELDEVKNLPDIVMPNQAQAQKEVVRNKERNIPVKEKVVPTIAEEVKFEKKIQKPQREVSASGAGGIIKNKEEIVIESEEAAIVKKIDYQRENWQVSNEEKNLKVVKRSDNQQDEEFKFGGQEEDVEIEEDQPKEDESEDEEEEGEIEQKDLKKEVLVKKLEKSLKKKQKIQNLIEEIKSNKFIKALGDKAFQEIINFFKLKLESEDEINEDDQDEIENFLKGKLSPDLQVQVIYNIYRLLGLQIELQKCEEDRE